MDEIETSERGKTVGQAEEPQRNWIADVGANGVAGMISPLSAEQQAAMELLLAGKSVNESARTAGVNRGTVYRWLTTDAAFQAAYNHWHGQMRESCRSRLLMLTDKAADAVERALEGGDAKVGIRLLTALGMMRTPKVNSAADAEEIRRMAEVRSRRRRLKLERAEKRLAKEECMGPLY